VTYLTLSRVLFWAFIAVMFAVSMTWLVMQERLEEHQQKLARQHRIRRYDRKR